jgi:DASH complex subunit DAD2
MSRPASLPASQAAFTGTNLTPSLQTLLQKQQEHAGLQALREASAELLARVEKLAEMSNVMADGGEGGSSQVGSGRVYFPTQPGLC